MKVCIVVEIVEGVLHTVRAYPDSEEAKARDDHAACEQENDGNPDYEVGYFERDI